MTTIDNTTASIIDELGLSRRPETNKKDDFGSEAFMTLMLAQLKNQSPLEPMENGNFMAQMAQFSAAAGMRELQDSFSSLAMTLQSGQALQASSLVGRNVLVTADKAVLPAQGNLSGIVAVPNGAGRLTIDIVNANGELVRRLEPAIPGDQGEVKFSWNGLDDKGQPQPPGFYTINAVAYVDNEAQSLPILVEASVESVTIGQGGQGLLLNLNQLGPVGLNQIRRIL